MPGPPGPCAQAQPPAITTPATAKTSRTVFNIFIDFSSLVSPRDLFSPSLLVSLVLFYEPFNSLRCFPSFAPAAPWPPEPAAIHRCLLLPADSHLHWLHASQRLAAAWYAIVAATGCSAALSLQRGFLLRCFYLLPLAPTLAAHGARTIAPARLPAASTHPKAQLAARRQVCRSLPDTTVRGRLYAASLQASTLALKCFNAPATTGSSDLSRQDFARQFVSPAHRVPLSSARTLPSARDKCAFTVPSLNPVARAISLNSCSST